LAPNATPDQVAALKARYLADPRVASVRELTSAQALQEASGRPGLGSLAGLSDTNPFPASLDVTARLVTEVGALAQMAKGAPARWAGRWWVVPGCSPASSPAPPTSTCSRASG